MRRTPMHAATKMRRSQRRWPRHSAAASRFMLRRSASNFMWYRNDVGISGALYLKRAKSDQLSLGTAYQHRARLAELVDLPISS